jgi:hypothetical protein
MRRFLTLPLCATALLLSACLGGAGTPGAGAPGVGGPGSGSGDISSFITHSAGGDTGTDAANFVGTDKPQGPVVPTGDDTHITMGQLPASKFRYGPDLSQVVDQYSPPASLDLSPGGQLDLQFLVEMAVRNPDLTIGWINASPLKKVHFLMEPAATPGKGLMCSVNLDPIEISTIILPGSAIHHLTASLSAGKLSPYLNDAYDIGEPDCRDGFGPISDEKYAAYIKDQPLGTFILIDHTNIENSRIRTVIPPP